MPYKTLILIYTAMLAITLIGAGESIRDYKYSGGPRAGVHATIVYVETSTFDGQFDGTLTSAQLIFNYLDDVDLVEDYWDLTGTVLSPTRAGDDIITTGEIRVGADQGDYDIQTADDIFAGDT